MKKVLILFALLLLLACNEPYDPCQGIQGSQRDLCIIDYVSANNDTSFCDTSDVNDQCIKIVAVNTKNSTLCEGLNGDWKDNCFLEIFLEVDDGSNCYKIKDNYKRSVCYYDIAPRENFMLCNSVVDTALQTDCYEGYAYAERDDKYCEMIFDTVFVQTNCYRKVARLTMNETKCDKIVSDKLRGICKSMFVNGTLSDDQMAKRDKDIIKYSR